MKSCLLVLLGCVLTFTSASAATEQEIVDQSVEILTQFREIPENAIPPECAGTGHSPGPQNRLRV
jgi:hypothetical protein